MLLIEPVPQVSSTGKEGRWPIVTYVKQFNAADVTTPTIELMLSEIQTIYGYWGPTSIAEISGRWDIKYSNRVVRRYAISSEGVVTWDGRRLGRIEILDGTLVLKQLQDEKVERLTLGLDGRLFVEHWRHTSHYPDRPFEFGISTRPE